MLSPSITSLVFRRIYGKPQCGRSTTIFLSAPSRPFQQYSSQAHKLLRQRPPARRPQNPNNWQKEYADGMAAYNSGDYREAEKQLKAALKSGSRFRFQRSEAHEYTSGSGASLSCTEQVRRSRAFNGAPSGFERAVPWQISSGSGQRARPTRTCLFCPDEVCSARRISGAS